MYLVDTNVWLERLLNQARAEEVGRFLDQVPSNRLFISDFAFHTIGITMTQLKRMEGLLRFVDDAFVNGAVGLIRLEVEDTRDISAAADRFSLDFDDAY